MKIQHQPASERFDRYSPPQSERPTPILFTGEYPNAKRFEFDYQVEADGVLWVYVYCSVWADYNHFRHYEPIRRIPMGRYRS